METSLARWPEPPTRIRLPSCDMGGFDCSSRTRSWLPFSDHECTWISPWTRTSPGGPVLTWASPLPLVMSMRTGPLTVKVLSKVPSAVVCDRHPASRAAAKSANKILERLREGFIFCRRLDVGVSGMCSECSRPSFLSEIYEEAQPEVPLQRVTAEAT